jgi:hypothetical protein
LIRLILAIAARNPQGIQNRLIETPAPVRHERTIRRHPRLGGLLNYYQRSRVMSEPREPVRTPKVHEIPLSAIDDLAFSIGALFAPTVATP